MLIRREKGEALTLPYAWWSTISASMSTTVRVVNIKTRCTDASKIEVEIVLPFPRYVQRMNVYPFVLAQSLTVDINIYAAIDIKVILRFVTVREVGRL